MANICNNEFYLTSDDSANIKYAEEWFENSDLDCYIEIIDDNCIEGNFSSRWAFPEELMQEFVDGIPNKEDIYIRVMSIEYGCYYHEMMIYDGEEWLSV